MTDIINTLLPFIPEKYRGLAVLLITTSPLITRAIYALMNGRGIKGTFAAIWLGTNTPAPSSSPSATKPNLYARVAIGATAILFAAGCHSTPQQITYKAAGATDVTVQAALATYDTFAAVGKTTPAQNSAVKAAFEKYQIAFAVVCDAGAIYAATSGTNAPAASLALQTAIMNANQTITDLLALVQNINHKQK